MFQQQELIGLLKKEGASLIGFADLSEFYQDKFNQGISIAIRLPIEVITNIHDGPTKDYYNTYYDANAKLNHLALECADYIKKNGYEAFAQTTEVVKESENFRTTMPHKTVAVNAGLGWIGKSDLFVTEQYGSAVRLTSVLTNAPIQAGVPITESKCGGCMVCTNACPGKAIHGKLWSRGVDRDELVDVLACRKFARQLAYERIQKEITLCGKCIESCPYTQRYLKNYKD